LAIFVVAVVAAASPAQERSEQGLALTFESLAPESAGKTDTRQARMLALYVPEGTPPTPFFAPGRFRATWTGDLNLRLRERLAFLAAGRGKVTVKVKDNVVFEAEGDDFSTRVGEVTRLDKGKNPIVVTYESPEKGDAFVRLSWKEQRGLRAEPVPPMVFTHDASAKEVVEGMRLREGRQLLANLRCTKCHDAGPNATAMPELAADAPSLTHIGMRLQRDWMAAWIHDPRALRSDAHMPRMFHDSGASAADVAAYLASLSPVDFQPRFIDPKLAPRGGQLFASLNCVGCHTPPGAMRVSDSDTRIPLSQVSAKLPRHALADYLLNPHAHYVWNPMPNFKLGTEEADSLAAFLLEKAKQSVPSAPAGDPAKGKHLVQSSGCLNCHTLDGEKSTHKAPALAAIGGRWTQGCMAPAAAARGKAPDFGLTDVQRNALLAFAATDRSSLMRETAAEFSTRQVAAMRCTACHARDGREALVSTDYAADAAALTAAFPLPQAAAAVHEGEHFAPDQRAPLLTWTGEKFRPEWSAALIGGEVQAKHKPRPYLHARMPAWPTRAKLLAQGLSAEHGYAPMSEAYPPPDEQMAPVGQKLTGAAGGFSCVQCHAVGPAPPLAPFEAPAMNMQNITERLRKDYYHRWMLNPIKVEPSTKMPAFADAEGRSAIRDVYEGDAIRQFEAIWQFLLRGKDVKPPQ
jgi:mono/diheme cytochrome c family protein